MRLQASKQGSVVMLEIKVFQSKFGVFDCDLFAHKVCYFHFYGIQKSKAKKNSKPFCIFWSPCRGAALLHAQSVTLGSGCSCHNLALDPSVCKEPETQHTKKKTIGICLYGCAHQHWEFKNSKRVLRGQIRSIVGRYTCLVSRAGPRIHCITDETDCFHRAQDFRVCGRSSSVGKIRLNQPQAPPPFLICLGVSKWVTTKQKVTSSGELMSTVCRREKWEFHLLPETKAQVLCWRLILNHRFQVRAWNIPYFCLCIQTTTKDQSRPFYCLRFDNFQLHYFAKRSQISNIILTLFDTFY